VRALQFQPTETMMIYEATFPHHFNLVRLNWFLLFVFFLTISLPP
jgi:hypothetical protein